MSDKAVQHVICELWIHIKCNNLNHLDYRYLQKCDESWYCIECCSTIFPFNSLSSKKNSLACCTNTHSNITQSKDLENDHASLLSLKPSSHLELLLLLCSMLSLTELRSWYLWFLLSEQTSPRCQRFHSNILSRVLNKIVPFLLS